MRNILIGGILLLLAGCQNVAGPSRAESAIRVDDRTLTIAEQQRFGRDQLAVPEDSSFILPPTGIPRPGVWGAPLH
jgi:hypothetical protein